MDAAGSTFAVPPTAGPAFSSSRILRLADLPADEQEAFIRFMAEQHMQVRINISLAFV